MVLGVLPPNYIICPASGTASHGFLKKFYWPKEFHEDGADLFNLYRGGLFEPLVLMEEIKNGRLTIFIAVGRELLEPSSWCGNGWLGPFSEANTLDTYLMVNSSWDTIELGPDLPYV